MVYFGELAVEVGLVVETRAEHDFLDGHIGRPEQVRRMADLHRADIFARRHLRDLADLAVEAHAAHAHLVAQEIQRQVLVGHVYYLGWALATISMTVDPEIFVIGGGVSKAGTFLTDWIDRYYRELTPISENKGEVRLATLGNDAGIYGAARLILD